MNENIYEMCDSIIRSWNIRFLERLFHPFAKFLQICILKLFVAR